MATVIIFCDYTINANKNSSTDNKFCKLHFIHKQLNQAVAYTWGGVERGQSHIYSHIPHTNSNFCMPCLVVATYSLKCSLELRPRLSWSTCSSELTAQYPPQKARLRKLKNNETSWRYGT